MWKRDYRHRESKKPGKDAKKVSPVTILPSTVNVEVVGKKKKHREREEEEV